MNALQRALARRFRLSPQLSRYFSMLVLNDHVTPAQIEASMGEVQYRTLNHKLRKVLSPNGIEIFSQRSLGYWLADELRVDLQKQYGGINDQPPNEAISAGLAALAAISEAGAGSDRSDGEG